LAVNRFSGLRKRASQFLKAVAFIPLGLLLFGSIELVAHAEDYYNYDYSGEPSGNIEYPPLSPKLPLDVDEQKVRSLVKDNKILEAHKLFATLAWQAFIALNWPTNGPAHGRGEPFPESSIGDNDHWRLWDYWRSAGSVFLDDGSKPAPWNNNVREEGEKPRAVADLITRSGFTRPRDNFEAFTGPLVDQNGKWVRFEIRLNKEEFNYIVGNGLYSVNGQIDFAHRDKGNEVEFPTNRGIRPGAIEIKLAWKEMGPNDDRSRFYTTDLEVTPSEPNATRKKIRVGLVGMHIAMRTKSSPEWIWSTFEQIDNVRSNPEPDGKESHPNFVDPASTGPFNVLATPNAEMVGNTLVPASGTAAKTWIESLTTTPTQVKRITVPIDPELNPWDDKTGAIAKELNGKVQAMLAKAGSVFQYYELIDVQWPVHPNLPSVPGGQGSAPQSLRYKTPGEMIPTFLINTTMETFFQGGLQPAGPSEQDNRLSPPTVLLSDSGQALLSQHGGNSFTDSSAINGTESCVGCHFSAGIAEMFRKDSTGNTNVVSGENSNFGRNGNANFDWMISQEAQPTPAPAAGNK
jgi:hypothetical protein